MLSKNCSLIIALMLFAALINTKTVLCQRSEVNDTVSYQNIVLCEKIESELLFEKITSTIYQIYDSASISVVGNNKAEIHVRLKIYSQLFGKMGHPAGLLFFLYKIEVKDEKFRCLVDSFYFKPMERDRYGRFQEVKSEAELVCGHNFKSKTSLLKRIKIQSEDYASGLSEKLKTEAISQATATDW